MSGSTPDPVERRPSAAGPTDSAAAEAASTVPVGALVDTPSLEGALRAAAGGDRSAMAAVYKATWRDVIRLLRAVLGDVASVEQAVVITYVEIWRRAATRPRTCGARAWVLAQAAQSARTYRDVQR